MSCNILISACFSERTFLVWKGFWCRDALCCNAYKYNAAFHTNKRSAACLSIKDFSLPRCTLQSWSSLPASCWTSRAGGQTPSPRIWCYASVLQSVCYTTKVLAVLKRHTHTSRSSYKQPIKRSILYTYRNLIYYHIIYIIYIYSDIQSPIYACFGWRQLYCVLLVRSKQSQDSLHQSPLWTMQAHQVGTKNHMIYQRSQLLALLEYIL